MIISLSCKNDHQTKNSETAKVELAIENKLLPSIQFEEKNDSIYNLEERMKKYGVQGINIAVSKYKSVVFNKYYGYSDVANKRALTDETLLSCCSVSKVITLTRILQLVQDGRLNLDEDVNLYLNQWKVPENEFTVNEKVTIRRLLEHYSGLSKRTGTEFNKNDVIPTTLDLLNGNHNDFEPVTVTTIPGSKYDYSANNYLILQQVITELDGSFEESIKKNIFLPLEMHSSNYKSPFEADNTDFYATGYTDEGKPLDYKWTIKTDLGAAGVWSNASDLIKLISNIQYSFQEKEDGILSVKMVQEMNLLNEDKSHLGFMSTKHTFGHPGGCEGFSAMVLAWKEKPYSIAITMNGMSGSLRNEIIYAIISALDLPCPDYFKPKVFQTMAMSDDFKEKYVGEYSPVIEKSVGNFTVEPSIVGLQFSFSKTTTPLVIRPLNDSIFVDESGYSHKFILQDGKVIGYNVWEDLQTMKVNN